MTKRSYQVRVDEGIVLVDQLFAQIADVVKPYPLTVKSIRHDPCSARETSKGTSCCVFNYDGNYPFDLVRGIARSLNLNLQMIVRHLRGDIEDAQLTLVSLSQPVLPQLNAHLDLQWRGQKELSAVITWQPPMQ